jgi:hypothetical protein
VVALFERFPGHGQYAAPIVRDIMKAYFDKKVRMAALDRQKQQVETHTAALGALGLPEAGRRASQLGGPGSEPAPPVDPTPLQR